MTNESNEPPRGGIDRATSRDKHDDQDRTARLDDAVDEALRRYADVFDRLRAE